MSELLATAVRELARWPLHERDDIARRILHEVAAREDAETDRVVRGLVDDRPAIAVR